MTHPSARPPVETPGHRSSLAAFLVLTLCFAGSTVVGGWWGVPIVGLAWGAVSQRYLHDRAGGAAVAALGAATAWAALLLWTGSRGPLLLLATTLGGALGAPGPALIGATLGFAALLAWAGATSVSGIGSKH